jgi:hypothetical protein
MHTCMKALFAYFMLCRTMPTPYGNVAIPHQFASRDKMKQFSDFLFIEGKSGDERVMFPDEIGGELVLTKVHMLEVEVDGVKIDGAYVSIKDALAGAIRTFTRVNYLYEQVSALIINNVLAELYYITLSSNRSCIGFATVSRVN